MEELTDKEKKELGKLRLDRVLWLSSREHGHQRRER